MATAKKTTKKTVVETPEVMTNITDEGLVNVKVIVTLHEEAIDTKNIYIVGNIIELGAWNPAKALKLKSKKGVFEGVIKVSADTLIEFKVCNSKDKNWSGVEKGMHSEELNNHSICANENCEIIVGVQKWRNE